MKRNEVDSRYKWKLNKMVEGIDIDKQMMEINTLVEDFTAGKESFLADIEFFKKSLDKYFQIWRKTELIYVYSHHNLDQDLADQDSQNLDQKMSGFIVDISSKLSFYMPLLTENIGFVKSAAKSSELSEYRQVLNDIIRSSKYVMSAEIENVLSLGGESFNSTSNIYSKFMNVDLKFSDIKDSDNKDLAMDNANYSVYLQSQDRTLRENAFNMMYDTLSNYNQTISEIYTGEIKKDLFFKRVKSYDNLRQKALFGTQIPEVVYDNLIKVINDNMNLHNEYLKIRKDKMGLSKLKMHDLYPSLHSSVDKKVSFEEAKEIIIKALAPLGDEYIKYIKEAFDKGYIDVYPNENKRSGAYSGGCYDSYPYILLNYTDTLNDVYTLAHELGHSMHTYLSNKNQTYQDASYKIFIAEIASTLNELLLTDYLLNNANNDDERKYILNYKLEQYRTTVFRQTMFAEFEFLSKSEVENTNVMSSERLNEIYLNLVNKYFADIASVDERIKYEWMRIPHFYYNYYVYQYATSFCAAVDIYKRIKVDSTMVDKYLKFLSLGGSVDSLSALQTIDIDFMKTDALSNAMKDFADTIKEYRK